MRRLQTILLILLAALLITQAVFSLQWPIAHDEAPLFYEAFLMQTEGRIPYRDIFDFQMPGSYIAYYLLGSLSGFNAFRIRILDILLLAALIFITYRVMRRFGKTSAFAAGILFGLKYLQGGPSLSLQREYLLLIFIALSLLVGMRDSLTPRHRLSLGILFGLAAVIKPTPRSDSSPSCSLTSLTFPNASTFPCSRPPRKAFSPPQVDLLFQLHLLLLGLHGQAH